MAREKVEVEVTQMNRGAGVCSHGIAESKMEFMRMAEDWFENHGTSVDDYDEFQARFAGRSTEDGEER